jgi:hypothetical protein
MLSYKQEHEAFVSNLKGASIGCLLVCLVHAPIFVFMAKVLLQSNQTKFWKEFLFLCLPLILIMTLFSDYNYLSCACFSLLIVFTVSNNNVLTIHFGNEEENIINCNNKNISYLTIFKGFKTSS